MHVPLVDLEKQQRLLRMEFEFEKEAYRLQAEQTGIYRKIQQGQCWYPLLIGKSYYNSLNQLVVEVEKRDKQEIEHALEPGKPVCFFTEKSDGSIQYLHFSATISYVKEHTMVVVLPSPAALQAVQSAHQPGVQLFFDETSYRTMSSALAEVIRAKDNRLAQLRDVALGKAVPEKRRLFPIPFPWLNPSQEAAVNKVLEAKDIYVIHGPPGTGKTTTLVEAIYETLHRENQVMVCAQSNTAVDWISEKLVDRGISVLRIGNPTRVNDKMLSFTYERRFEAHPSYPELWSIRKAIRELYASRHKCGPEEKDTVRNRLSKLKFRATELEIQIDAGLFTEARVIACTLIGSANRLLDNHQFSTLFIDEAAQALEAACWVAITKAGRVILAGDHFQLPPTVKCPEAAAEGLNRTLLEKIADTKPDSVSLLQIQYRMHDDIMSFPSRIFYDNKLVSAPEVKERGILSFDTPLVWLDTSGCDYEEEVLSGTMSRINRKEAELTVLQLQVYIEKIGRNRVLEESVDFGVISPYKSQIHLLRRLIKRNSFFKPYRKLISVHTVDGFQGQERDVILISLVRSNPAGQIGFLNDIRRMNVAITRTRMKLFLIGNATTLCRHSFYNQLFDYTRKRGMVIGIAVK